MNEDFRDNFQSISIDNFKLLSDTDKKQYLSNIFPIINSIFKNNIVDAIPYLDEIYSACNRIDKKLIKTIRNTDNKLLLDYYKDFGEQTNDLIEKHRCQFIKSQVVSNNMMALLNRPTIIKHIPTPNELDQKISSLDNQHKLLQDNIFQNTKLTNNTIVQLNNNIIELSNNLDILNKKIFYRDCLLSTCFIFGFLIYKFK